MTIDKATLDKLLEGVDPMLTLNRSGPPARRWRHAGTHHQQTPSAIDATDAMSFADHFYALAKGPSV